MGPAEVGNRTDQVTAPPGDGAVVLMEKWLDRGGKFLLLKGSRCPHCGRPAFPPKVICPSCGSPGSMEEIRIGPKGTIHAFTVAHIAAAGFPVPYAFGWVDFPEGIRFFGRFHGSEEWEIGMEVTMTLGKIREQESGALYGPMFTAAERRGK